MSARAPTERVFVALDPPLDARRWLAARATEFLAADGARPGRADLGAPKPGARWRMVPAEDLHLTLVFLGAIPLEGRGGVPGGGIGELAASIARRTRGLQPVTVELDRFGAFPSGPAGAGLARARVLWVGRSVPEPRLHALYAACHAAAVEVGHAVEPLVGLDAWVPHVTLARPADRAPQAVPAGFLAAPLACAFEVAEVVVHASRSPKAADGRYPALARISPDRGTA
ncbi:MAG: 2'-5' RNA ligase family protein [Planctomycetes bacterium]|nr:2'-5' RNA ligase family protein [Planctomycetota bacterium]